MKNKILGLFGKRKHYSIDRISIDEFYNEPIEEYIADKIYLSTEDVMSYKKNDFYWENGRNDLNIDRKNVEKIYELNNKDYLENEENFNDEKQKEINKHFDNIINIIAKKLFSFPFEKNAFIKYRDHNRKFLTTKEREAVKKYLINFLKMGKHPFILNINKTYMKLYNELKMIENLINRPAIHNYGEFMTTGNHFYHYIKNRSNELISFEKEEESNKQLQAHDNKVIKNQIVSKKIKVTTDSVKKLETEKRKLHYKTRKLMLFETKRSLILTEKLELTGLKYAIKDVETDIYNTKVNDQVFNETIKNSKNIRREKAMKSINVYLNRFNKGKIKESIEEYFGFDQVLYFKSLGIDIDLLLNTKEKTR